MSVASSSNTSDIITGNQLSDAPWLSGPLMTHVALGGFSSALGFGIHVGIQLAVAGDARSRPPFLSSFSSAVCFQFLARDSPSTRVLSLPLTQQDRQRPPNLCHLSGSTRTRQPTTVAAAAAAAVAAQRQLRRDVPRQRHRQRWQRSDRRFQLAVRVFRRRSSRGSRSGRLPNMPRRSRRPRCAVPRCYAGCPISHRR